MYGIEDRAHLEAIAYVCDEHVDMLWQDDYFDMWDNHLAPLFKSLGDDGDGLPTAEMQGYYKTMNELAFKNADAWNQEDWYLFCDAVFDLMLAIYRRGGQMQELLEKFPYAYSVS